MVNFATFFSRSSSGNRSLWDFPGGIHPAEMKAQSSHVPLRTPPLPARLILPLKQHLGSEGELSVQVGERVLRGQPISQGQRRMLPVHAPTSGQVLAIEPHITAHPSALNVLSVIIGPDGEDRWIARQPWPDYQQRARATLIDRIGQFGIAGLGGAGFPTGVKLADGGDNIRTLIINAAECEPYITADDRLMQECAIEIITGIHILTYILQPSQVLIGIEDNKPQAITQLQAALAASDPQTSAAIALRVIPTKYPSGASRQLTQILTGQQVPQGGRSSDIGVLMHNVGTVYAIKRAIIDGEPLTERVVTLTGAALQRPGNVWARIGTPVRHLLEFAGFTADNRQLVIMGGPLMGFTLPCQDVPVTKISNCLLTPSASEMGQPLAEKACIRCSACADACPVELLPQQLYWFGKQQQHDKASTYHLNACIECGACAWVCPSNIPLVHYFRQQKAQIHDIEQQARQAATAKARFTARQQRLEQEKIARNFRHKQAMAQADDPLAAQPAPLTVNSAQKNDPRKMAVAAALARVKARKAQQQQTTATQPASEPSAVAPDLSPPHSAPPLTIQEIATLPASDASVDPRKAAVAAALARVRARKAQQQQTTAAQPASEQPAPTLSVVNEE